VLSDVLKCSPLKQQNQYEIILWKVYYKPQKFENVLKVGLILKRVIVNFVFAYGFMNDSEKNPDKSVKSLKDLLTKPLIKADSKTFQYSGLGLTLVVTILVFLWIGMWLDGKFQTGVLFTLILAFIGFAAGFYSFYLNVKKLTEEDKKEKSKLN